MANIDPSPSTVDTNPKHQLHGLDNLRALAITMVFFCHYNLAIFGHPTWLSYARFGWTGVDLFFVLSGFLISSQLFASIKAGKGVSYKTFFLKRFFRIVPAFCAVVALYYLFPLFREEPTVPPLSRLLSFTHNLGLDVHKYGAFSHSWSLCVEEHFYVALPLALIVLERLKLLRVGPWFITTLFVGGFVVRQYVWTNYCLPHADDTARVSSWFTHIYYPTYSRLDGLLAGVSIAGIYTFVPDLWQRMSKYGNLFILAGLIILGVASVWCSDPTYNTGTFGFPMISLGYAALVIAAVSPSSVLYQWRSKATALIASLSYGIYLLHKGVITVTQHAAMKVTNVKGIPMMLLCMTACIAVALALYHTVERPFMKLRDRILYGAPTKIVETAPAPTILPDDETPPPSNVAV